VVQFGHHLKETVLYPVPHRQYVFAIPKILRKFFFYDRKLLGRLSQCAVKSLTKFFQLTLGKKTGIPGVIVAIQTFGDYVPLASPSSRLGGRRSFLGNRKPLSVYHRKYLLPGKAEV
jgi:hypothetical protein